MNEGDLGYVVKHEYCDVLVIGGGPGGISAASKLALTGNNASSSMMAH